MSKTKSSFYIFFIPLVGLFLAASSLLPQGPPLLKLSAADHPGFSRVSVASAVPLNYSIEKKSASLLVTLVTANPFRVQRSPVQSRFVKSIGWSQGAENFIIIVETRDGRFRFDHYVENNPYQLVIDLREEGIREENVKSGDASFRTGEKAAQDETKASPVPQGERLGEKRIRTVVIDPGHGGMETGAKGKFGTMEKDITLAISLKLKAVIERNLDFRVILTRDKDTDVALENRAALANNHKADLFISIHANGSSRKKAQGSESFFLSLNATDEEARRLAYMENTQTELASQIDQGSQEDVKMILWDMAQSAFIKQSSRLAEIIQDELNELLGTRNRGIKQAPFKVLTGVASPAVLVEVAFISNPDEEKKLLSEDFQNNVAEAVYRGLAKYLKLYS